MPERLAAQRAHDVATEYHGSTGSRPSAKAGGYAGARPSGGQSGGLLFAVSHRAYGDDAAKAFLTDLATLRREQIDLIAAAPLPAL